MPKANPKVADVSQNDQPLVIEDAQPVTSEPAKPVSTETKTVNGHEMTFEDY